MSSVVRPGSGFMSARVEALAIMTLCTGLMNNLGGITSVLVALQLLPLCSSCPLAAQDVIDLG